jgi:putative ATPase
MAPVDDLFAQEVPAVPDDAPLAARMRPLTLDEYTGQLHLLGPGKLLRRAIEADRIGSLIFYGPPGTGKTSLALVIAATTDCVFERTSGVEGSASELRRILKAAALRRASGGRRTVVFVDEIHRFNRAQQDVLLPEVETGAVRLIGATTENPFFSINSALVSRSQIFQLQPLGRDDLRHLLHRAIRDPERGLGKIPLDVADEAVDFLAELCDGDARKALNALEIAVLSTSPSADAVVRIDLEAARESIQKKAVVYDGTGDAHYDTASAFIKSIRGSDPDAAVYWLAKMLHAGEELRFIARRLVICASEDIGLADSQALVVAQSAAAAVEWIGLPEAELILAHATLHLATAPKSNSATMAISRAAADVREGRTLAVPPHLRDSHYAGAGRLGHGKGYLYSHDFEDSYVPQAYLPEGRRFYEPTGNGMEKRIRERLDHWRAVFEESSPHQPPIR